MSRDDQIDSLSWAAATIAGAAVKKGGQNRYEPRWLGYYGPATTIPNVSLYWAVLTNSPDCVPAGFFSNKVVFVGAHLLTKFSGERKDEFPTPHSRWAKALSGQGVEQSQREDLYLKLQRINTLSALYTKIKGDSAYQIGAISAKKGNTERARKYLLKSARARLSPSIRHPRG